VCSAAATAPFLFGYQHSESPAQRSACGPMVHADVSGHVSCLATIACSHSQNMLCNRECCDRLMHVWLTRCQAAALTTLFCSSQAAHSDKVQCYKPRKLLVMMSCSHPVPCITFVGNNAGLPAAAPAPSAQSCCIHSP